MQQKRKKVYLYGKETDEYSSSLWLWANVMIISALSVVCFKNRHIRLLPFTDPQWMLSAHISRIISVSAFVLK